MMSPDGKNPASAKLGPHKITLQKDNLPATLADYQGKVVVLDFWATYCPPCVKAMPDLEALHQKYAAQGLNIIGLNVGGEEDRAGTPDFLRNNKINVSYTLAHLNESNALTYYTGTDDRIPQTLVYDRQGNLVTHLVGYNDKIKQDLETAIQNAMAKGK
jgi:thiol-disulfide isomerase/thioredoxin